MRQEMMNRRSARGGFTLFELCLCVLIIGIAAAAIVPAVGSNIRSPRLRTAANVLAADIDFCASETISQPGSPRSVTFDVAHNTYSVTSGGTAISHPMDSQAYTNDFATGRNTQLTGVTITGIVVGSGTASTLTFDAYGKPALAADMVITLTYGMQSLRVTVSATTGEIAIN